MPESEREQYIPREAKGAEATDTFVEDEVMSVLSEARETPEAAKETILQDLDTRLTAIDLETLKGQILEQAKLGTPLVEVVTYNTPNEIGGEDVRNLEGFKHFENLCRTLDVQLHDIGVGYGQKSIGHISVLATRTFEGAAHPDREW